MVDSSSIGLLLVAHGTAQSDTEDPAHAQAATLRRSGGFASVEVGFLRDRAALRGQFDAMTSTPCIVVPFFTANGYFTRKILPETLGLSGRLSASRAAQGETVMLDAIGTWDGIGAVVSDLAEKACREARWAPATTALLLAGHGNPRDQGAERALRRVLDTMDATARFCEVHAGFIEQAPYLDAWQEHVRAERVVVVPFLMARGDHFVRDIPRLAGLPEDHAGRVHASAGKAIRITEPLGAAPQLANLILEKARHAVGSGQ